tara:strand:+ start:151 stop:897 length:747 start_codon:yes stop_codon:yes gene_type:complete
MNTLKGQKELDEYKLTRKEVADFLGITTNAVRMSQRGNNCHNLEYRFDGTRFLFKVPRRDLVRSKIPDHPLDPHKTSSSVSPVKPKKVYNRGATHRGKGNYHSEAFRLHNEMKILNSINGRFKNEAQRKEFDKLNEEALKTSQENLQRKEQKELMGQYKDPGKYGGMLYGLGIQRQDDRYHEKKLRSYNAHFSSDYAPGNSIFFGTFGQQEKEDRGAVEIDERDIPAEDGEPEFKNKIDEAVWRLKNQ